MGLVWALICLSKTVAQSGLIHKRIPLTLAGLAQKIPQHNDYFSFYFLLFVVVKDLFFFFLKYIFFWLKVVSQCFIKGNLCYFKFTFNQQKLINSPNH